VVVAAAVLPGVEAANYPSAAATAACDVWAEVQPYADAAGLNYYKWGCAKYMSSGGTLTSCKVECASKYSSVR